MSARYSTSDVVMVICVGHSESIRASLSVNLALWLFQPVGLTTSQMVRLRLPQVQPGVPESPNGSGPSMSGEVDRIIKGRQAIVLGLGARSTWLHQGRRALLAVPAECPPPSDFAMKKADSA